MSILLDFMKVFIIFGIVLRPDPTNAINFANGKLSIMNSAINATKLKFNPQIKTSAQLVRRPTIQQSLSSFINPLLSFPRTFFKPRRRFQKRIRYLQNSLNCTDNAQATSAQRYPPKDTINSFKNLVLTESIYVDKTLLINELITCGDKIVSIIIPKRTGKSLCLSMVQKFLEVEVTIKGEPLEAEEKTNYKLFTGGMFHVGDGEKMLRKLKITQHKDIMSTYQGKFPVILLNLTTIDGKTYEEIENQISRQINITLSEHDYVLKYFDTVTETNELIEFERTQIQMFFNGSCPNTYYMRYGITVLCGILYEHFDSRSFVLVDGYDIPIVNAFLKFGGHSDEFKNVTELLKHMYMFLTNGNHFLQKGVLTGTMSIKLTHNETFHDVHQYSLLDDKFAKYFGFSQEEVDELLAKVPAKTNPNHVKNWYNGYNFNKDVMYNPWSITKCLNEGGKLDYYWLRSGGVSLTNKIINLQRIQKSLIQLVRKGGITMSLTDYIIDGGVTYSEYLTLVSEGYLNAVRMSNYSDVDGEGMYRLIVPNQEVQRIYSSTFRGI